MAAKYGMVDLAQFGISAQIPEAEFRTLKENFQLFDRDGGGEVSFPPCWTGIESFYATSCRSSHYAVCLGQVDTEELSDVLHSMGLKPTAGKKSYLLCQDWPGNGNAGQKCAAQNARFKDTNIPLSATGQMVEIVKELDADGSGTIDFTGAVCVVPFSPTGRQTVTHRCILADAWALEQNF